MTALGRDLWKLGGVPQRILTALEWAGTSADSLVGWEVPSELIAHAGIDELTAPLEPPASLARAVSSSNASHAPARDLEGATVEWTARAPAAVTPNTTTLAASAVPQPSLQLRAGVARAPAARAQATVAEARAWLSAKAARAGAGGVLDRPLAITAADGHSLAQATFEPRSPYLPAAAAALAPRSDPAGASTMTERLAAVLARIATLSARAHRPAGSPRDPSTPFASNTPRAPVSDALTVSPLRSTGAADEHPTPMLRNPMPIASSRLAAARSAPITSAAPHFETHVSALASPGAPAEPPLAEPPSTPLRRFAMLAEAAAPPAPGQVEGSMPLGPRHPERAASLPTPALDDVELAERLTRVLRREARRDGIDLDPHP
jgi:hypothetical protein